MLMIQIRRRLQIPASWSKCCSTRQSVAIAEGNLTYTAKCPHWRNMWWCRSNSRSWRPFYASRTAHGCSTHGKGIDAAMQLHSVEMSIPLSEIYAGVKFDNGEQNA